jgi:hypothetical protein
MDVLVVGAAPGARCLPVHGAGIVRRGLAARRATSRCCGWQSAGAPLARPQRRHARAAWACSSSGAPAVDGRLDLALVEVHQRALDRARTLGVRRRPTHDAAGEDDYCRLRGKCRNHPHSTTVGARPGSHLIGPSNAPKPCRLPSVSNVSICFRGRSAIRLREIFDEIVRRTSSCAARRARAGAGRQAGGGQAHFRTLASASLSEYLTKVVLPGRPRRSGPCIVEQVEDRFGPPDTRPPGRDTAFSNRTTPSATRRPATRTSWSQE